MQYSTHGYTQLGKLRSYHCTMVNYATVIQYPATVDNHLLWACFSFISTGFRRVLLVISVALLVAHLFPRTFPTNRIGHIG